jgi:hypothetical protein
MNPTNVTPNPRVVILGAGFGGLSAAKALANSPFDVTIVDQHNYHLFQPLLYQVATAGLSPADIASPVRSIMRDARNVSVVLAKVGKIDVGRREVVAENRRLPFDYLIVATGAQHAYFGHDEWEAVAPGLKTIDDATYLRRRILLAFEKAETEPDPAERTRLLNFIVVRVGLPGMRPKDRGSQGTVMSRSSHLLASYDVEEVELRNSFGAVTVDRLLNKRGQPFKIDRVFLHPDGSDLIALTTFCCGSPQSSLLVLATGNLQIVPPRVGMRTR